MRNRWRLRVMLLLAAAGLSACTNAPPRAAADEQARDCPDVTRLHAPQLYGSWELDLVQAGLRGRLTLRQHPEFSASLRGEFRYGGQASIASGDVEAGEFHLDESRDGKTLFAFWSGRLLATACGAEIRGQWQTVPTDQRPGQESEFILRRASGAGAASGAVW